MKIVEAKVGTPRAIAEGEELLLVTGATLNTEELSLEAAGVETERGGFIRVSEEMRTSMPGIWAVGDVAGKTVSNIGGKMLLETVAAKEGLIAAGNALESTKKTIDFTQYRGPCLPRTDTCNATMSAPAAL